MISNALSVWTWIFVAAIAFATLAIGVPLAIITILAQVERAGSWALEQVRRDTRWEAVPSERESEALPGRAVPRRTAMNSSD